MRRRRPAWCVHPRRSGRSTRRGGRAKDFSPYAGWSDSEEGITSPGGRRGRRAVPPRLLAQPCADVTRMPPASGPSGMHVPSEDMPHPQPERRSGRPRCRTCAAWLCVRATGLFTACDLFAPRSTDTARSPRRYVRCRTSATPHPTPPPMLWIVAAGIVGSPSRWSNCSADRAPSRPPPDGARSIPNSIPPAHLPLDPHLRSGFFLPPPTSPSSRASSRGWEEDSEPGHT